MPQAIDFDPDTEPLRKIVSKKVAGIEAEKAQQRIAEEVSVQRFNNKLLILCPRKFSEKKLKNSVKRLHSAEKRRKKKR